MLHKTSAVKELDPVVITGLWYALVPNKSSNDLKYYDMVESPLRGMNEHRTSDMKSFNDIEVYPSFLDGGTHSNSVVAGKY